MVSMNVNLCREPAMILKRKTASKVLVSNLPQTLEASFVQSYNFIKLGSKDLAWIIEYKIAIFHVACSC